ncbi:MAG: SIS domain-containing protein [Promethearchaeota archaeon]
MLSKNEETWDDLREKFTFVREIFDQPDAMEDLLAYYVSDTGKKGLLEIWSDWKDSRVDKVIVTGMGSSLFAGYILAMMLNQSGVFSIPIDTGELYQYHLPTTIDPDRDGRTLFILTSQSGESAEIIKLLRMLSRSRPGVKVWGITNTKESTLAREASKCLFLNAGKETSVTSKTFCNSILLMYVIGSVLKCEREEDINTFLNALQDEIGTLTKHIRNILEKNLDLGEKLVDFIGPDASFISIVGRGTSLASANQAGLNIKETNKIAAESLSGGQFRHGPIEMINKDFRCFLLISDDQARELSEKLAWNISHKWGGGKVVVITNKSSAFLEGEQRILEIVHPVENPYLAPIMEIIVIQLFMVKHALLNEIEPGVFQYSSKITKDG